jgi:predicted transcriptional regulator
MSAPGTPPQASSNEVARKRDALLLWLLLRHPATAGMLAGISLFPTRKKASRRLNRLEERGLVRCLGTVSLKDGRPEHVYARGRWKADNLRHEVQLTRVCLKIHADEVRRGAGEVDRELRPDAELLIAGERYFLELDCGTMSTADIVRTRFAKYQAAEDLVLWVCLSERQMEGRRRHAGAIRDKALFTTLDQALADPHAPIWVDFDGERAALPRSRGVGTSPGEIPGDKGGENPGTLSPPGCGGATAPAQEGTPTVSPVTAEPES